MSTMSPWVRTDAGTGAGTSTGAVTFDIPGEFDDPTDSTPLNLDDIPNRGLGAVLKSWESTLTQGCRLRPPAPTHRFYGGAPTVVIDDLEGGVFVSGDVVEAAHAATFVVERALEGAAPAFNILGIGTVGAVGADLAFGECRIAVPPLVASGSFQRQFYVLVTGDDALHLAGGVQDDHIFTTTTLPSGPGDMAAADVVGELQQVLQVSAAAILRATGISRRTYQHWKQTGATPRLSSEARLWDLVLTARGWADALGDDLPAWIRNPERFALLEAGSFEELTNQILSARVQLTDPSEARYRDRLAAGYFETTDEALGTTEQESGSGDAAGTPGRAVRRASQARRPRAPRRSNS